MRSLVAVTVGFLLFVLPAPSMSSNRPFWTEKSSYIEGDELFVVGVASNMPSVEEGRKKAFDNGKVELMNVAQVTDVEAQGLAIETQMTYEEPGPGGTVTVFRLLRVSVAKLRAIQGRLRTQGHAQEQALKQARQELRGLHESLTRKQHELDARQKQLERLLQQLKVQATAGVSLVETLKQAEAQLDQRTQDLEAIYRNAQNRVKKGIERNQTRCRYVVAGMTPDEVRAIMGKPDLKQSYSDFNVPRELDKESWHYGKVDSIVVYFNKVRVVEIISGCSANTAMGRQSGR